MTITDSQVHLFTAHSDEHPWPEQHRNQKLIRYSHLPEEVIPQLDDAGVARAVIVPPRFVGFDNGACLAWATEYPDRFAVMGRFDLFDPDRERLETWLDHPKMHGIRLASDYEKGDWLDVERFDWFWAAVERLAIPVMVLPAKERIRMINAICERHPDLVLIIDHFGTTIGNVAEIDPWEYQDDVLALAEYPNVVAKLSALPLNTLEPYPFPSQTPYIKKAYDTFGPKRLAWGSDMSRFERNTYLESVAHMQYTIDFLADEDKEWIMGGTISRAIRWPEP